MSQLAHKDHSDHYWYKIIGTRDNALVVGLSVALIVELATGQWYAAPQTMTAVSATVTGIGLAARFAVVGCSTLNLTDRVSREGWKALIRPESALDILTIISFLPKALPRTAVSETFWGRTYEVARNKYSLLVRDAAKMAIAVNGTVGGYQVIFAESLAQRMQASGMDVSAADIRSQGMKQVALSALFYMMGKASDTLGKHRHGSGYTSEMNKLKLGQTTTGDALKSMNPVPEILNPWRRGGPIGWKDYIPNGLRHYSGAIASSMGKGNVVRGLWQGVAIPSYAYIVANEVNFFRFTTPDFMHTNHVHDKAKLPDLREGESAVLFIGLDDADLLSIGAQSEDYQRHLRAKYGRNFHVLFFVDPLDFAKKLNEHAKANGKIRYLEVVTHGIPGLLSTVAMEASPFTTPNFDHMDPPGFISIGFLRKNKALLQGMAKNFMAKDAQINIHACLVGADYDNFASRFPGENGVDDIGDQFLDIFAEVMLPNLGRVDASTRALIGVDMIYSSLFLHQPMRNVYGEQNQRKGTVPLKRYRLNSETGAYAHVPLEVENDDDWPSPPLSFDSIPLPLPSQIALNDTWVFSSHRIKAIVQNFSEVTRRYGIALENNGLFDVRYKARIVTAEGILPQEW